MYLPVATRLMVDSCSPSLPATARWVSGRSSETPPLKKRSCRSTISVATLRMVRARCSRLRTSQPVTVLVLRHIVVAKARQFAEEGYVGTIAPFGPGSIAAIGVSVEEADDVATKLRLATEWSGT